MTTPVFERFWQCAGQELYNIDDVAKLVEQGHVAVEVSAEAQLRDWELRQAQQRWHAEALRRHAEFLQEAQYRISPEGQAAAARRESAAHGGSRVTQCGPQDAAFSELDAYSPANTNEMKR